MRRVPHEVLPTHVHRRDPAPLLVRAVQVAANDYLVHGDRNTARLHNRHIGGRVSVSSHEARAYCRNIAYDCTTQVFVPWPWMCFDWCETTPSYC